MKNKFFLGLIIAILLVGGLIWWLGKEVKISEPALEKEEQISEEIPVPEKEAVVAAGYGWSTKETEKDAVKEAVEGMRTQLKGKEPNWVMLISAIDYDAEKLSAELNKELGPGVKITGITTWHGMMNAEGWHAGRSMSVLGISSPAITFGLGAVELKQGFGRELGKEALLLAIEDAGKTSDEKPKIIIMNALLGLGIEQNIIYGIADVVGRDVPIFGGNAGDNDLVSGDWNQFMNDSVFQNALVLTVIYTDVKIGHTFSGGLGYLRTDKQAVATKVEGAIIYEIDGQPAADVYNEWLDGEVYEELGATEGQAVIIDRGIVNPLAVVVTGEKGITHYLTVHPIFLNFPEKSITTSALVKQGEMISIMQGSKDAHELRAPLTIRMARARGEIQEEEIAAGIVFICACTHMAIGNEGTTRMMPAIKESFGAAPFIGGYTFGEQGLVPGIGNRHQDLITNILIFGKN